MPDPSLKSTPARMAISNLASADILEAQFNPTELEESIAVNYERLTILGLSHMPLQYQQTQNLVLPFELAFRAFDDQGNANASASTGSQSRRGLDYARRFLYALCYPRQASQDVITGAPPRALFVWPKLLSLTCVVTALSWRHTLFNKEGYPTNASAKVTLEEIRDVRLYSEDVFASGTLRS